MARYKTHWHTKDGKTTPTYLAWQNMRARCKKNNYKKKGITICGRWDSFENFLADMGERPEGKRKYTLERMDNNRGYSPENCKWATWLEQGNNRSTNIHFTYKGKKLTLAQLARETGVEKEILRARLCRSKLPWTVEGAVKTPALTKANAGFYC